MNDRAYVRHIRHLYALGGFGRDDSLPASTIDRLLRICEKRMPPNPPPPLQPCGTYAAYQRHLRHGEPTCQPCRDARAAYVKEHSRGRVR